MEERPSKRPADPIVISDDDEAGPSTKRPRTDDDNSGDEVNYCYFHETNINLKTPLESDSSDDQTDTDSD